MEHVGVCGGEKYLVKVKVWYIKGLADQAGCNLYRLLSIPLWLVQEPSHLLWLSRVGKY